MLCIAICDDEKMICDQIKEYIAEYREKKDTEIKIDLFFNGEDLYEQLEKGQFYDLIFTDIEMYQMNGIEVGAYIRNIQKNETTQIVFVSSKQHYALELFAVRPLDFIVKPVTYDRIAFCIDFVQKKKERHRAVFSYQVANVMKTVRLDDVYYFQSNARKIFMKYVDGEDAFYGKLDEIETQLQGYPFLRIHKSALIHYMWVKTIKNMDVTMEDGVVLQISYPRKKEVFERINSIREKGVFSWE